MLEVGRLAAVHSEAGLSRGASEFGVAGLHAAAQPVEKLLGLCWEL